MGLQVYIVDSAQFIQLRLKWPVCWGVVLSAGNMQMSITVAFGLWGGTLAGSADRCTQNAGYIRLE